MRMKEVAMLNLNPVCMELTRSFKHKQKSKVTRPKNIKVVGWVTKYKQYK
jgi:hypothetical protein